IKREVVRPVAGVAWGKLKLRHRAVDDAQLVAPPAAVPVEVGSDLPRITHPGEPGTDGMFLVPGARHRYTGEAVRSLRVAVAAPGGPGPGRIPADAELGAVRARAVG